MGSLKPKELSKIGYTNDRTRSLVINIISKHFKHHTKDQLTTLLSAIKNDPQSYINDEITGVIAATFINRKEVCNFKAYSLLEETGQLKIYGGKEIERSAKIQMELALKEYTHFGNEGALEFHQEHAVIDSPVFQATELLKKLQAKASRQLGSSGSGNHFVEFGIITLMDDNSLGLPAKDYLALLSHSGSRGLGANIAQHYTKIAMDTCKLPREAQQLAWLDLNTEAGQEYWLSMNLAGDYAKACHERIHANLLKALGLQCHITIENHHNFAWEDTLADGREVIIHRKGATPAHAGEWGIIPGSMTTAAYLVKGKGVDNALFSASHGAGRAMSRKRSRENMTASGLKKMLSDANVTLIGGSVEENPLAYKDIEKIIAVQQELVAVEGRFLPRIVRMNKE